MNGNNTDVLRVALCGDVMTGRGIDQILPCPGDPELHESWVRDARFYVSLAEQKHGAIPRPASWDYVWGEALPAFAHADLRIVNLETSITASGDWWRGKGIHYRMHPRNIRCLEAGHIDCCCLANNHVLDWGYAGLEETLHTLDVAGIARAGAGRNAAEAAAPAILEPVGKGRVLVFSYGMPSSGIPPEWAATRDCAGVNLIPDNLEQSARKVTREMDRHTHPGDILIVSIHWGENWGHGISAAESRFAEILLDHGAHIIHGHSSHHVKRIALHGERPVLHGCGDFLTDYEGIGGHEEFRPELAVVHQLEIAPRGGCVRLRLLPLRMRRFRLERAPGTDARWLAALLSRLGKPTDTCVDPAADGWLDVHPIAQTP